MGSGYTTGRDSRNRVHQPVQDCRSCGRRMLWVTMPSGRRNALDLEAREGDPEPDTLVIDKTKAVSSTDHWRLGVVLRDRELIDEALELGLELRTSHFATCPGKRRRHRADIDD